MPRIIPQLDLDLRGETQRTQLLVRQFELAKAAQTGISVSVPITMGSIDLVYELAYLNIFKKWEDVLEQFFIRIMCGYENGQGAPQFALHQQRQPNLQAALQTLLGGRAYLLWHNPQAIVQRSRGYFVNHAFEQVVSSNLGDLEHYANIRHRIAHGQDDSRAKFDISTMALSSRRYRGSSAGRFLRDFVPGSAPPARWLNEISGTLESLAAQIRA